ncbi:hypothetical protein [Burkholderia sp. Tr-20390]|uniref:hypothetical protein n=1 Tax=Burkholderia sp. Tr-20390 TaxID=2703904 RepID=UPI001980F635|nr:hypothetical protein [Burkholderia sp. Tr-20390]MBN3729376.1 hypothetical protein [Burkholderia sp. Tr-20390]
MTARGAFFLKHSLPSGDVLLSVAELQLIREQARTLLDRWIKEGEGELSIAYGAYLPQIGVGLPLAERDIADAVGHGLGFVFGGIVQTLQLVDIDLRPSAGSVGRIPFAALVRAPDEPSRLLRNQQTMLAAFLRYSNLDPATNILNRPGVFAMQMFSPALSASEAPNWTGKINEKQLRRSARWVR